jgi:hypothetical protein
MEFIQNLLSYWWIVALLLSVIFYRNVFQLLGIVFIPEDKIGLVTKKFVLTGENRELPEQVSKPKPLRQVFISGNGFGNMKSFYSL